MSELNAIIAISYRDLLKLLRDPARIAASFISPLLLIGILGGTFQTNLGKNLGFDFMLFVFTGILAQTLFTSAAQGVISLMEDREYDFSQDIFVSPISRYSIVFGKILGESLVALPQGMAVLVFAAVIGIRFSLAQLVGLALVSIVVCLFGGTFGLFLLANIRSQRAANQIFPFILLPQFLLAGIFNPIRVLPWYLDILSRISPMRYAVDLTRSVFYFGQPDYPKVVLDGLPLDMLVIGGMFFVLLVVGTFLFVRGERNR